MRNLILLIISFFVFTSNMRSVESDTSTIPYFMYNAASKFDLDISLMYAICRVESNCKAAAINHDDATPDRKARGIKEKSMGLFQIKPATAKSLGFILTETVTIEKIKNGKLRKTRKQISHVKDLLSPEVNAWYAAKLLRHLYDRYHDTVKVISAYNAGKYTTSNKEYVNKVLRQYARYKIDKRY